MSNQYHVGRGANRGALTIFPIWTEVAHPVSYSMDPSHARIGERRNGPQVGRLTVSNTAGVPLLLLQGQLVEGGWQDRMVTRSTLLAPGAEVDLDVVCVEHGRWGGGSGHSTRGRRASTRVRAGLRSDDNQGEVWRRVAGYEGRLGHSATSSYLDHANQAQSQVRDLVRDLHPFPGQTGVLIGLTGHPLAAEIFDTPRMPALQFNEIVHAAAIDAIGQPPIVAPGRRARRFLKHADHVKPQTTGTRRHRPDRGGHSADFDRTGLRWENRELHTLLTNPRHELVLAA